MWYQEGGRGGGRGGGSRHCKDQKSPELLSRLALQVLPPQNDDDEWLCRCSRHQIYFKLCLFTSYVYDRHIFHNFHYGLFLILVCFRRLHCYLIKIITIQIFQEFFSPPLPRYLYNASSVPCFNFQVSRQTYLFHEVWRRGSASQVPQPTCYWKWLSSQLGNLTRGLPAELLNVRHFGNLCCAKIILG